MAEAGLHVYDGFWDLRLAECPCDAQFVEWLDRQGITDSAIYHFGSGGHHYVGVQNARPERRNARSAASCWVRASGP